MNRQNSRPLRIFLILRRIVDCSRNVNYGHDPCYSMGHVDGMCVFGKYELYRSAAKNT